MVTGLLEYIDLFIIFSPNTSYYAGITLATYYAWNYAGIRNWRVPSTENK